MISLSPGGFQVPNFERPRLRSGADDLLRVAEPYALHRRRVAAQTLQRRKREVHNFRRKFLFAKETRRVSSRKRLHPFDRSPNLCAIAPRSPFRLWARISQCLTCFLWRKERWMHKQSEKFRP